MGCLDCLIDRIPLDPKKAVVPVPDLGKIVCPVDPAHVRFYRMVTVVA